MNDPASGSQGRLSEGESELMFGGLGGIGLLPPSLADHWSPGGLRHVSAYARRWAGVGVRDLEWGLVLFLTPHVVLTHTQGCRPITWGCASPGVLPAPWDPAETRVLPPFPRPASSGTVFSQPPRGQSPWATRGGQRGPFQKNKRFEPALGLARIRADWQGVWLLAFETDPTPSPSSSFS